VISGIEQVSARSLVPSASGVFLPRHAHQLSASRRKAAPGSANPDSFWVKDESVEHSANLPDPDSIAEEIVEDLQAALAQFTEIAADLRKRAFPKSIFSRLSIRAGEI
jgi:hypothetical protein